MKILKMFAVAFLATFFIFSPVNAAKSTAPDCLTLCRTLSKKSDIFRLTILLVTGLTAMNNLAL